MFGLLPSGAKQRRCTGSQAGAWAAHGLDHETLIPISKEASELKILRIAIPGSGDEDEILGVEVVLSNGAEVRIESAQVQQVEPTIDEIY
jgi:hypothetical protein